MPKATLPASAPEMRMELSSFRGVDFSSSQGDVDPSRSPDCLNMMLDRGGRPVKRLGYEHMATAPGGARINGVHTLVRREEEETGSVTIEYVLVHAGTALYVLDVETGGMEELFTGMADARSSSFQLGNELWLLDGKALRSFDGSAMGTAEARAYVPRTGIGIPPEGGGEPYEDWNLLSNKAINLFSGTADAKVYQLNSVRIDGIEECAVMKTDGSWEVLPPTDYSANLLTGKVTFVTPPGKAPVPGEDNVRITFRIEGAMHAERINKCTVGILWGIGGNNRLVLSGNPDFPNMDFTSELPAGGEPSPTYFPDTGYALAGGDASRVMGYARMGEDLALLKEENGQDATIYIRKGTFAEGILSKGYDAVFTLKEGIAGVGAVSPYCMCDLRDDPLFLSAQGVFGLATNEVTSKRAAQLRSELVNKRLCAEPGLEEAVAIEFESKMYLAVNGHVYVADASQRDYVGRGSEQAQYEWCYWDNIPARVWFRQGGRLWFGTADGKLMRFFNVHEGRSYYDDGAPIRARWTTPELSMGAYSLYKTLNRVYVKLTPYARSGVEVYLKNDGGFDLEGRHTADLFSLADIDFRRFTFSTDTDVGVVVTRLKRRRLVTVQVKLENSTGGEAFGLTGITLYFDLKTKVK